MADSETPPVGEDLAHLTRDELDTAARAAGVEDPEGLPNKQAVVDAIDALKAPATDDADAEPEEREYEVTGPQKVFGHKTGETFTRAIPAPQEARLLTGGHITRTEEH